MVLFLTLYRLILRNIPSFYKMGRDLWTGFYSAFCQFLSDSDTFVMTNMIYWELVIIEIVKGFLLMSVFSDMLKNYIHEKDVKVGALAHYCQLERSTIYKFINGKREPMSAELVEQIAYFIKLIISVKVLNIFYVIFQTSPLHRHVTLPPPTQI